MTTGVASLIGVGALLASCAAAEPPYEARRAALVAEIERGVEESRDYTGIERLDPAVLRAIGQVARHEFVPEDLAPVAYENTALPIGAGQTISQPFIVALMTHLAAVGPGSVVLEVGTGSGYQAAVLAEMGARVYSIEIVESLGRAAATTLERLGYGAVTVRIGDGYAGWPDVAPFDAILVTAAPEAVPEPLVEQLKPGGRLVVPVGAQDEAQSLEVLTKGTDGRASRRAVLPVLFVPLTRGAPR